jgi:hypothetical protein
MNLDSSIEIWGGLECTINRVRDNYHDQFILAVITIEKMIWTWLVH